MGRLLSIWLLMAPMAATAGQVGWGVGVDMSVDLGDPGLDQGAANMGLGTAIRVPIRWVPHPIVALRVDPFVSSGASLTGPLAMPARTTGHCSLN
jgi:hypothetical protein